MSSSVGWGIDGPGLRAPVLRAGAAAAVGAAAGTGGGGSVSISAGTGGGGVYMACPVKPPQITHFTYKALNNNDPLHIKHHIIRTLYI